MSVPTLYTIGYSGLTDATILAKLHSHDVEVLVDVRDRPFSRNRYFNQARLKGFLEEGGIAYVSYRDLGVPANLRKEFREGGSLADYLVAYRLSLQDRADVMSDVGSLVREKTCCLLCLEHDPAECHRSVLAEELGERMGGMRIVHIL